MEKKVVKTMNKKTWLNAVCAAVVGGVMLAAQPAQAGMGTGNPPPPPPPPVNVSGSVIEQSDDTNISGKGIANATVLFTPTSIAPGWVGRNSTTTDANGKFNYVIRSDQGSPRHRATAFGTSSGDYSAANPLIISTNARLTLQVPSDEKDFADLAKPGGLVTTWKIEYTIDRGSGEEKNGGDIPMYFSPSPSSFAAIRAARHKTATATNPKSVTFRLKKLEGYGSDASQPLLSWLDKPENGVTTLVPGDNKSFIVRKIVAVTQK